MFYVSTTRLVESVSKDRSELPSQQGTTQVCPRARDAPRNYNAIAVEDSNAEPIEPFPLRFYLRKRGSPLLRGSSRQRTVQKLLLRGYDRMLHEYLNVKEYLNNCMLGNLKYRLTKFFRAFHYNFLKMHHDAA